MRTLGLDFLRAFVAVVDHGGFTVAGEMLGRTQSAISMQIRKLEDSVGRKILIRNRGDIQPPRDGELLLARARQMLSVHDDMMDELSGSAAEGRVRLGIPDDYAAVYLAPALSRFAQTNPRIELEIQCAESREITDWVDRGELAMGIVTHNPDNPGGVVVRSEEMVWVAATGHRPEEMRPLPLALFGEQCLFRPFVFRTLKEAGVESRIVATSTSLTGILSICRAGIAVSPMARGTVPEDMRIVGTDAGLPQMPPVDIMLRESPGGMTRAAKKLRDHLIATLRDEPLAA